MLWQVGLNLVKVPIVSRHLARDKLTKRKFMKIRREKTDELQKSILDDGRFDRG